MRPETLNQLQGLSKRDQLRKAQEMYVKGEINTSEFDLIESRLVKSLHSEKNIRLNDLLKMQEAKINKLIRLCSEYIPVFDFDGTLTEVAYTDYGRLLPCKDDDIGIYCETKDMYANANCLMTMQYVFQNIDLCKAYILTKSFESVDKHKNNCIIRNFPDFRKENIIHTRSSDEKLVWIQRIYEKYGSNKKVLFVEDTLKTLLNAEEQLNCVRGFHISSVIA